MAKRILVTTQGIVDGASANAQKEIITGDDFDLYEEFYSYMTGVKTGANGNAVSGAMIGPNHYFRFADIIDIAVEEIEDEE